MSYNKLEQILARISHLSNINSLAQWDAATGLSPGSAPSRNQEIATVSAIIHEMITSDETGKLISDASKQTDQLSEWQRKNLAIAKKDYDSAICIDSALQHEYSIASSECELIWRKARKENNFNLLAPYLDRVFLIVRKIAGQKSQKLKKSLMDVLIDTYDPGRTCNEIVPVFNELKPALPGLMSKIMDKQRSEKVIAVSTKIDESTQKAIGLRVMQKMGFDMERGRLDKSAHPFCSGSNDDVRLTTRYDANYFLSGLFGIIHEAGHGLYQQNLPVNYRDQPVGQPLGMAFHESQSLIMELQAGTSRPFIGFLSKMLYDDFSLRGAEFSEENLYRLVTRVKPSLIRVDADEVTYPLHVILRFEIENEIINNNLKAADLPELWNAKMQEYLGIVPDSDANGCMQDIHWPSGSIGYFPSYTNGAIIAGMLMASARSAHPSIDEELEQGNFISLNRYLNENLRQFGSLLSSSELLKRSTGYETVKADIFLNYLHNKYLG